MHRGVPVACSMKPCNMLSRGTAHGQTHDSSDRCTAHLARVARLQAAGRPQHGRQKTDSQESLKAWPRLRGRIRVPQAPPTGPRGQSMPILKRNQNHKGLRPTMRPASTLQKQRRKVGKGKRGTHVPYLKDNSRGYPPPNHRRQGHPNKGGLCPRPQPPPLLHTSYTILCPPQLALVLHTFIPSYLHAPGCCTLLYATQPHLRIDSRISSGGPCPRELPAIQHPAFLRITRHHL